MSMSQIFIRTSAFACDIDQNISWWAPYIIRSFLGKLLLHSVPDETPLTLCSWGSHVSGITIHCRKSAIRFQQHLSWEPSDELFYSCCTSCILFGARIRWGDEATAHRRDGAQAQVRLVRTGSAYLEAATCWRRSASYTMWTRCKEGASKRERWSCAAWVRARRAVPLKHCSRVRPAGSGHRQKAQQSRVWWRSLPSYRHGEHGCHCC